MTTSPVSFLSEIVAGEPIPVGTLAYFRQRLRNRLYELVLSEFLKQSDNSGLTKAEITRRIRSTPSIVSRWLAAPGNWEIDTISDLLLSMGAEPSPFAISYLKDQAIQNYDGPEWIYRRPEIAESVNEMQRRMQRPPLPPQDDLQTSAAGLRTQGRRDDETERNNRQPSYPGLSEQPAGA